MSLPYQIAAEEVIDESIINRSRFICYLSPCDSNDAAKAFLKNIQQLHPQARHHCYAFVSGHPKNSQCYGFSDDGEPSGTAGMPMLKVLQGSGIGEICAVVVRYFGGIKLGTGGLQRAYGGSVRQALELLTTKTKIPMVHKTLACQYTQVDDILHLVKTMGGQVIEQHYQEQVVLILAIPEEGLQKMETQLQTLSSGQLTLKSIK
ncbi:YigZ family protein [Colwelliaceae bacterium 6441]